MSATMPTGLEMNDLAAHSLDLVSREIGSTLDTARRELEDFAEGNVGRDALDRAADLLHLAQGALKIIELHGAGMLAEEMERSCRHVRASKEQAQVDAGLEALTRAMVQLPAYLERVMSGGRDIALVLLPMLNDLRQVRGEPLLSEGSLLLLNAGPFERHIASQPGGAVDAESSRRFQTTARRLRPAFQSALLQWIRGNEGGPHLDRLIQISGLLEQAAATEPVRQLWFVLTGVLGGLRGGHLEPTVNLKRLVGQADRQLKQLIDRGESPWVESPPVDLLNSLLYYVARAGDGDERLAEIRKLYRLDEVVPPETQLAEARESLAGPSIKLMRTVAKAIKEDLSSVKDALDIFVRTGMEDLEQLKPQLDMLKKIGDTLGVLGLEKARAQIQREARELTGIVGSGAIDSSRALEKIAATLLDVEDALDRELVRAIVPSADDRPPVESESEAQYRHVTQAVLGECIVNLAKVKEAVTQLLETPEDGRALDQVKPQLRGITAGLLMLNKTRAVKIVERIGAVIATRLGPGAKLLKPDYLERLADAVVAVEYYMETISRGRSDPWYMLDNASRCLDLLEALPPTKSAPAPVAVAPPPTKTPKPPKPLPSVMEVDEERSDPELLELFIDEAKEEMASIARYLPIWAERPEDSDALISVRRSFHTLKGSGRMVGAQMIGEFAWSIENLLNRLINQTLEPTPAMVEFIIEAADVFPQLIEHLEVGIPPRADVQLMMKRATAFAEGDPEAASLTSDSLRLPAPGETDAAAAAAEPPNGVAASDAEAESAESFDSAPSPEQAMDPVLVDIFVKETLGHLETLRGFIDASRRGEAPYSFEEPVYRACHTLLGSAKMAAYAPAVALAGPLSEHLGRLFQAGRGLLDDGLETVARAADELARMTDALLHGAAFEPDPEVVARLERLEEDAVPEKPAAADVSSPALELNFDPEIAAIFMEEAAEILESAESALGTLRSEGEGSSSIVELQRLLHTLKGGARMAGVLPMGDLSHALETLLVGMAEKRVEPAAPTLDLLQQCLDTLHAMRDCIDAGKPVPGAAELVARIEAVSFPGSSPAVMPAEPAAEAPEGASESSAEPAAEAARPQGEEPTVRQLAPAFDGAPTADGSAAAPAESDAVPPDGADTAPSDPVSASEPDAQADDKAPPPDKGFRRTVPGLDELARRLSRFKRGAEGKPAAKAPAPDAAAPTSERVADAEAAEAADASTSAAVERPAGVAAADVVPLAGDGRAPAERDDADASMPPQDKGFRRTVPGLDELARRLSRFKRGAEGKPAAKAPEPDAAAPTSEHAENAEAAEAASDRSSSAAVERPAGVAAADVVPFAGDGGAPAERDDADVSMPPQAPPSGLKAEGRGAERTETARVDAALLDALLNGAGEINIFQSRLNQQLHSIDFHLGELGQTVTRLREQLRKLEAETEAQILHRHQDDLTAGGQGFDPLELDRYSTIQQLSRALAETANDVASINELLHGLTTEAETLLGQQARVTSELQEGLMQTRMVPFQRHTSRLSRIVRQAASDTNKLAELVVHGGASEVDRQVLDSMLAPFEHLLRNAVVHGIEPPAERREAGKPETGRVDLSLRREGSEVLIEVADDGRGLDLDAIRRKAFEQGLISDPQQISDQEAVELILRPGFSTASELTQAAGRGVGMDVVDNEIKKLGGSMRIESGKGRGTRFYIRLPYTLAVTHALIVDVGDETFALPLPTIEGVTRVPRETLLEMLTQDEPRLEYGGVSYRIQHLGSLLGGMPSALPAEESAVSLVLVRAGEHSTALLTDALEGSREIVVKTLGPHLGSIAGVSGATILGDGRVIVILDAGTLVRAQHGATQSPVRAAPAARQPTALVVDDSITMRRVTQRLLERRGVRVVTARDGLDAITTLQEHEPDIILLDIEMPRMDGYQFASHVRNDEKLKDVPIVMITSRSGEKHRAKAIELGVNDYLSKPYQEAQLIASVEALLGRTL